MGKSIFNILSEKIVVENQEAGKLESGIWRYSNK